jgi:hypothetical protein
MLSSAAMDAQRLYAASSRLSVHQPRLSATHTLCPERRPSPGVEGRRLEVQLPAVDDNLIHGLDQRCNGLGPRGRFFAIRRRQVDKRALPPEHQDQRPGDRRHLPPSTREEETPCEKKGDILCTGGGVSCVGCYEPMAPARASVEPNARCLAISNAKPRCLGLPWRQMHATWTSNA